jgi:hypothetical protein
MVQQLLAELEWTMKTAMEQATEDHTEGGLTIDPAVTRALKRERAMPPRAP